MGVDLPQFNREIGQPPPRQLQAAARAAGQPYGGEDDAAGAAPCCKVRPLLLGAASVEPDEAHGPHAGPRSDP
eukprot:15327517-Alexandrium_andersonii.AAC.1